MPAVAVCLKKRALGLPVPAALLVAPLATRAEGSGDELIYLETYRF